MVVVKLKEGEDRKTYLARVAVEYLRQSPEDLIVFDESVCDGYCLADDIEAEFDL